MFNEFNEICVRISASRYFYRTEFLTSASRLKIALFQRTLRYRNLNFDHIDPILKKFLVSCHFCISSKATTTRYTKFMLNVSSFETLLFFSTSNLFSSDIFLSFLFSFPCVCHTPLCYVSFIRYMIQKKI